LRSFEPSRYATANPRHTLPKQGRWKLQLIGLCCYPPRGSGLVSQVAFPRIFHRVDPRPCERVLMTLLCFASPTDATISAFVSTLRVTTECLSWDCPKIAPPLYTCRRVHSREWHCCRRFETSGTTVHLRSAFTVSHRPDGLRLFDPARILQRAANHGVRDVLPACEADASSRGPALRSLLPFPSQHPPAFATGSGCHVTSLSAVHRAPCPLILRSRFHGRIAAHTYGASGISRLYSRKGFVAMAPVARIHRPLLPWACCSPPVATIRALLPARLLR
jgi:hypothetical protein